MDIQSLCEKIAASDPPSDADTDALVDLLLTPAEQLGAGASALCAQRLLLIGWRWSIGEHWQLRLVRIGVPADDCDQPLIVEAK